MLGMRNSQWWTGALLLTLMLFIVVFAYVARKPLCIDSKLVQRIDSISDAGTATAYRCGLRRHVDFDPNLASQTRGLSRRLQALERFFEWLGPLKARVNLTIISGKGSYSRIQGHEIYMSESILNAKGQLEKAFLRVWFRERTQMMLQSQLLIEESLTDLLYHAFAGELDLQDPRTGLSIDQDPAAKWPRVLVNLKGYCKSIWISADDLKICDDADSYAGDEILPQSLRPLITQTLIDSYEELSPSVRIQFLRKLAFSLPIMSFHEKNFGMTSREHALQSYHEAVSQLENWSYFLSEMKGSVPEAQTVSALFDLNLRRRGFDGSSPRSVLDILIFTSNLSEAQRKKVAMEVERHPERLIGIESEKQIQMSFLAEPLNLKFLAPVQATTGILIQCGPLALRQLSELAKKVQKLLYIRACGNSEVQLSGFFEKGVTSFAAQNPELKFAQLHLPSLIMASSKIQGANPFQLINENKKDHLRPLGWKEPTYDESIKAYRAKSAIEFVDWYRL